LCPVINIIFGFIRPAQWNCRTFIEIWLLLSHQGEVPEFEVFAAEGAAANTSNSELCHL